MNSDFLAHFPATPEGREVAALHAQQAALDAAVADHFRTLLERMVARLIDDPAEVDEALRTGGLPVDGRLVVMRLTEQTDEIEWFVDLGEPASHSLEASYRALLEINLCRTYPGTVFGVHPESGRLVATQAVHAYMVADEEVCLMLIKRLVAIADAVTDSGQIVPA